jgi:hypothetical protein
VAMFWDPVRKTTTIVHVAYDHTTTTLWRRTSASAPATVRLDDDQVYERIGRHIDRLDSVPAAWRLHMSLQGSHWFIVRPEARGQHSLILHVSSTAAVPPLEAPHTPCADAGRHLRVRSRSPQDLDFAGADHRCWLAGTARADSGRMPADRTP